MQVSRPLATIRLRFCLRSSLTTDQYPPAAASTTLVAAATTGAAADLDPRGLGRAQELAGVGAARLAGGADPGLHRPGGLVADGAGLAAVRRRALDRLGHRVRDPGVAL